DPAPLARAVHGRARLGRRALRRAVLPAMGILPGLGRDGLSPLRPHGLPAAADQAPGRAAGQPRLHLRGRTRGSGRHAPAAFGVNTAMRLGLVLTAGLLALACSPPPATSQAPPAAPTAIGPPGAPADAFPAPERPVADIVSPVWNNPDRREAAGEVEQIVERMGVRPDMTVADIGAGDGFIAVRLSPVVGARGRVIAQDVTADYLRKLDTEARRRGLS